MGKSVFAVCLIFLFAIVGSAQQEKPSPAKRQVDNSDLKQAVKPAAPTNLTATVSTLPVGTPVRIRLETALATSNTQAGDTFSGRVLEDVKLNDRVILPVGATLQGRVVRVSQPRRIKGKPMIQLLPEAMVLPNGRRCPLSAAVVDTNKVNGTSVDEEGRIKGPGHTDRDVMEVGAGTGVGAIVGGIAAGGKGSLIGAGIGAGATVIHWLTKRNSFVVPAGSEIIFELTRPMMVEQPQLAGS